MKTDKNTSGAAARILSIAPITDERVIALIQREGLSLECATNLCRQIKFADKNGKQYLGYGMVNRVGGCNMITLSGGTNNVGPGDVVLLEGDGTDPSSCLLFVGLRDAVAYHTMYGPPASDAIVMCSTSFAKKAVRLIRDRGYRQVWYYPPNTEGKMKSMPIIGDSGVFVWDMSAAYSGYKDLRLFCSAWARYRNQ